MVPFDSPFVLRFSKDERRLRTGFGNVFRLPARSRFGEGRSKEFDVTVGHAAQALALRALNETGFVTVTFTQDLLSTPCFVNVHATRRDWLQKVRAMIVSAILLGAGESKRMGADKLSLPLGRETVLERSLDHLVRSKVDRVIVVLGGRTKGMKTRLEGPKVRVVINPRYREGMSTSIRQGLRCLGPDSQGILIALGDQPFVGRRTIDALIDAFGRGQGGIVVPSFKGKKGHPVVFDRKYEKELMRLRGDAGGRTLLKEHRDDILEVRTKSEGVVKDLDTREEYNKLKVNRYKL